MYLNPILPPQTFQGPIELLICSIIEQLMYSKKSQIQCQKNPQPYKLSATYIDNQLTNQKIIIIPKVIRSLAKSLGSLKYTLVQV